MPAPIRGAQPPISTLSVEIVRVKSTEPTQYVCLSERIYGVWTHWHSNRTHECTIDSGECEGCTAHWPRKWKGYVHVAKPGNGATLFIEMTPEFQRLMLMQLPVDTLLRGVIFRVSKTKGGAKGRYIVDVQASRHNLERLPGELNVLPTLKALWAFGKKNCNEGEPTI